MKFPYKSIFCAAALAAATLVSQAARAADTNLLFILDGSNSMWGQIDGVAKIRTAKDVLSALMSDLPADTSVGLMAYGHRVTDDCSDVETLAPIGSQTAQQIADKVRSITPKGKTPIAVSIRSSAANFSGLDGRNNQVVLISDGIESCDGDPCAEAAALAAQGIGVRVNVVGFDVDSETRAQLECIADKGKGRYFDAHDAGGFREALAEVKLAAAAEPEPAPAAPASTEVFRDDFDGDGLAAHWEVINPDPDKFIVENGFLNVLTDGEISILDRSDNQSNLLRLKTPLPGGDWTATLRVKPSIATFREIYSLSLYTDKDSFLAGSVYAGVSSHAGHVFLNVFARKAAGGKNTDFDRNVHYSGVQLGHRNVSAEIGKYTAQAAAEVDAILIRMRKVGRSYFVAARIEPGPQHPDGAALEWVELNKLTSLRSPGDFLTISAGQGKFKNAAQHLKGGETLVNIDWLKIEADE
jgi:hypothetical protein